MPWGTKIEQVFNCIKIQKRCQIWQRFLSYAMAVLETYFPVYFPMKKIAPVDCSLIT